jgi:DNA-binding response OmpR family regulator
MATSGNKFTTHNPSDRDIGGLSRGESSAMFILLVEDDEAVRFTTAELMRELGHEVIEAENAENAMAMLRDSPVDILVTDVGLPDTTGDVFAAEARSLYPTLRIVFATGLSHIPDIAPGLGGPVLLRKPYSLASLDAALKDAQLQT